MKSKKDKKRLSPYSKVFVMKEVAPGVTVFLPVFSDLDDDLLHKQFNKAIEDEDFEYAQACAAEAALRGYSFPVNVNKNQ